jgi:hypothetical protein
VCFDFFIAFCIHERRLEQSTVAREATLLTECQGKDVTSKVLAESQGRIEGLVKEIDSANRKMNQLKKTVERFVVFITGNHLHPLHLPPSANILFNGFLKVETVRAPPPLLLPIRL